MTRRVVVAAPDLLIRTRIAETARAAGVEVVFVAGEELLAAGREHTPDLIVVDLTAPGDPPRWVRALKSDAATSGIALLGFYPHVRDELRATAKAAGADLILPRSAFVSRMASLLAGAGVPRG